MRASAPRATNGLAIVTGAAYLLTILTHTDQVLPALAGFIPARVAGLAVPGALPLPLTPLTATLLHAGWMHLAFNLLMLVYCGREDEVALGKGSLLFLYAAGAYAAAVAQYLVGPGSANPMIGASGAISALVGAYAILYGQRRPSRLHPELARWLHVLWLAIAWLGLQLLLGLASATAGVAIAAGAHVGGFAIGLIMARPLLRWRYRTA